MADRTRIEWADATWNLFVGCSRVSAECDGCYAKDQAARLARMGLDLYQGLTERKPGRGLSRDLDWTGGVRRASPRTLRQPFQWRRPRRIFVGSMSDFFHPAVPLAWQAEALQTMAALPRHTFLILTKRPDAARAAALRAAAALDCWPAHVWVGASVGIRAALPRVAALRTLEAPGRFLSLEPLLEPLDGLELGGIGWVIAGGESGPGARPLRPEWVRAIREQCVAAAVPFFFKQWGGANKQKTGRLLDGREWNARPREMP